MDAKICDVCNTVIEDRRDVKSFHIEKISWFPFEHAHRVDLCKECLMQLIEISNANKRKKNGEY